MEKAGQTRPPGAEAHHIVAGKADGAKGSRELLQKFGVGINEAENGVFLPVKVHRHLHTGAYYRAVEEKLATATTRAEALDVLAGIRYGLLNGGFP
ncbi:MAG: AHH domain-containing protein [Polyangiaceae bacterium]|nr:AHH domain-containing protein [Polyangiaceae bacterium]